MKLDKVRQESRSKDESLRKLEENCQNLETKIRVKEQLCRNLQEKVIPYCLWKSVNHLFIALSKSAISASYFLEEQRTWRPTRVKGGVTKHIRQTTLATFRKIKGEGRSMHLPSAKGIAWAHKVIMYFQLKYAISINKFKYIILYFR